MLPRELSITLLVCAVAVALGVELGRRYVRPVRYAFLRRTRRLLRGREKRGLSGATYMAIGYLTATVVFPRPIAVAGMLYNAFGDGIAALVGPRWGRHRITGG